MAEHDGTRYPLAYCLLSMASSIEIGKCTRALKSWVTCLHDDYNIDPDFCHLDKDMGEIRGVRGVWKLKLQLWWWHMQNAVKKRLAKKKLATTPYNREWAQEQLIHISGLLVRWMGMSMRAGFRTMLALAEWAMWCWPRPAQLTYHHWHSNHVCG
jgi:hypothetical protein